MSNENIIDPAPAQTSLQEVQSSQSNDEREKKIKRLREYLRQIENICGTMTEYTSFQHNINPKIRVFMDMDKIMVLICALKTGIMIELDEKYNEIENPPESLKVVVENANDKINHLNRLLLDSMKQIFTTLQSTVFDFDP